MTTTIILWEDNAGTLFLSRDRGEETTYELAHGESFADAAREWVSDGYLNPDAEAEIDLDGPWISRIATWDVNQLQRVADDTGIDRAVADLRPAGHAGRLALGIPRADEAGR